MFIVDFELQYVEGPYEAPMQYSITTSDGALGDFLSLEGKETADYHGRKQKRLNMKVRRMSDDEAAAITPMFSRPGEFV